MDQDLARYLNDHLAGSSAALPLIQKLAENHDSSEARDFFLGLKLAVEADQSSLEDLLERIGQRPSTLLKMAGGIAARIASIKLMWEKVQPGELGLFEALEMLALGVQGKHQLWVALGEISAWVPEWDGVDFVELDLRAIQQRDAIEDWRIQAAKDILPDGERRESGCPMMWTHPTQSSHPSSLRSHRFPCEML